MQRQKDTVAAVAVSSAKPFHVVSLPMTRSPLAATPYRPEGVALGTGHGAKGKGSLKGARRERGIMFGAAQNAAASVNIEIQKCAAPAVAAIALGGQAPAGAVQTMMMLLTSTQHIQVRCDCMDALSSLVSKDLEASSTFLSLGGMEVVLGFEASSSSRLVHRKALDLVEALVRHAPKTEPRFSDQVLAGLVCYIRNRDHFTSQHAATKLVRLTRAANAAGEVWRSFVEVSSPVGSFDQPLGTLRQLVLLLQQTICADSSSNVSIESLSRPASAVDENAHERAHGDNGADHDACESFQSGEGLMTPLDFVPVGAEAAEGDEVASVGTGEGVPEDVRAVVQEMVQAVVFNFGEEEDTLDAIGAVLQRQRKLHSAKRPPQQEAVTEVPRRHTAHVLTPLSHCRRVQRY